MKATIAPILAAGLIAAPLAVSAQDLNYNYIQGGFAFYPSYEDQDFIGVDAKGSIGITPDIFIFGGMMFLTDDADLTTAHLGAGYRFALARGTDVYGGVTLEYQEIESSFVDPDTLETSISVSTDDTSIGLRGGIRHMLSDDLEVGGQVRYVTGDMDYFGLTGSAQYFMTDRIGLVGEVDLYDGELGVIGSARFNF